MTTKFTFRLYGVSLETVQIVAALLRQIAEHDPDLAKQGRRSLSSIHLNLAESIDAQGGTRRTRLRTALGSTNETIACLDVAEALGYLARDERAHDMLQRVRATLLRCVIPKR